MAFCISKNAKNILSFFFRGGGGGGVDIWLGHVKDDMHLSKFLIESSILILR